MQNDLYKLVGVQCKHFHWSWKRSVYLVAPESHKSSALVDLISLKIPFAKPQCSSTNDTADMLKYNRDLLKEFCSVESIHFVPFDTSSRTSSFFKMSPHACLEVESAPTSSYTNVMDSQSKQWQPTKTKI